MKKLKKTLTGLTIAISLILAAPWPALAADTHCDSSQTKELQKCLQNNPIIKDLNDIITFLSAVVGIVIIGAMIYGGIRYSMAGDSPQETGAAKQQITNALIALVAFICIFSILQWLIPGGLFG